ncbi:MAG: metallophosphoesterase family protein [Pseudomonadales bacterium]
MKVLVIGDIHGNAEALRAVMAAEADADSSIFLGDALLSGPQANETMELLDRLGPDIAIMGNHDDEVLDPSLFAKWPAQWVALNEWILAHLDASAIKGIEAFSEAGRYQLAGLDLYLHHGELGSRDLKALPDAKDEVLAMMGAGTDAPTVLFGHTHVQFTRHIGDKTFINPGSVGQPRCGKLQACYGVFEDGIYKPRQVQYDPAPWLAALDRIEALESFPDFRQWLKDGLLDGYGIGRQLPWTQYAAEGYH